MGAVLEYTLAHALKECTQITFAIRSLSGPTNTDVRCEIRFPDGFILYSGPLFDAALPFDLPQRPMRSPLDMMGHFTDPAANGRHAVARIKSMVATSDVSVKGEAISLWLKKAQHSSTNQIAGRLDIVTVLPPLYRTLNGAKGN